MHTYQLVTTFKERLSDLCEASPKNDTDLARDLDISKQTLSAWKCGTRSPKRPTIITIARYFDVSVDWLMGFDVPQQPEEYEKNKPIPEDELDNELISLLSDLTHDEILRVIDFVSGIKAARATSAFQRK